MVVTPLKPSRFKADIPTQRDPNEDLSKLKPNPLTLVVTISPDLQIKLNQDALGSVNDTAPLAQKLARCSSSEKNSAPTRSEWKPHRCEGRRSHREDRVRQGAASSEIRRRSKGHRRHQGSRRESGRITSGRSSLVNKRLRESFERRPRTRPVVSSDAGLIKLESRINETLSDQDRHRFGDPCCH